MEDLRFYDFEFNILCIVPRINDACWELKFNGVGSFEAEIVADEENLDIVMSNENIIVVQGTKQAIITEKFVDNGKLVIYGRTVNFILTKRIVQPFDIKKTYNETQGFKLIEKLIEKYFPEIEVEYDCEDQEIEFYRLALNPLSEVIFDILDRMNCGNKLVYHIKKRKWILNLYRRRESNLFLSEDNGNIYNSSYRESILDYANCGVYVRFIRDCGNWDAYSNVPPLSMGNSSNLGKLYRVSESGRQFFTNYEEGEYIACISEDGNFVKTDYITEYYLKIETDKTGFYKWESELSGNSRKEAEKSLQTKKKENEINAKVRAIKFEKDYNLGDVLRIQKHIGKKVVDGKRLVSSVQIWYTSRECGEKPRFKEV